VFDVDPTIPPNEHYYPPTFVKDVVEKYNAIIRQYLDVPTDKIVPIVMGRDPLMVNLKTCKEGIHIIYPWIITDYEFQFFLRDQVIDHYREIPKMGRNDWDMVFDKAVIKSNAWLLYENSKAHRQPYTILQNEETLPASFSKRTHLLSVRNKTINAVVKKHLHKEYTDMVTKYQQDECPTDEEENGEVKQFKPTDEEFHLVSQFMTQCLDLQRSERYITWRDVGFALINIEKSERMEQLFHTFSKHNTRTDSKRYPYSYDQVHQFWFKTKIVRHGIKQASLEYWCKLDNPDQYDKILNNHLSEKAKRFLKCGDLYSISQVIVIYCQKNFRYEDKQWFYFNNNKQNPMKWYCLDEPMPLVKMVDVDIHSVYRNAAAKAIQDDKEDESKAIQKVMAKLRNNKAGILKETSAYLCEILPFKNDLYSKAHLFAFNNGV
jgi:hypothetical protein